MLGKNAGYKIIYKYDINVARQKRLEKNIVKLKKGWAENLKFFHYFFIILRYLTFPKEMLFL